jgi:hypothetical protein
MNLKTLMRANLDRVLALVLVLAGAVLLVLGWVGVSGVALAPQQIPYLISGGLGGLFLGGLGVTAWLSADLHDEWRRLDSIEAALTALAEPAPAPTAVVEPLPQAAGSAQPAPAANGHRRAARVSKTLA